MTLPKASRSRWPLPLTLLAYLISASFGGLMHLAAPDGVSIYAPSGADPGLTLPSFYLGLYFALAGMTFFIFVVCLPVMIFLPGRLSRSASLIGASTFVGAVAAAINLNIT